MKPKTRRILISILAPIVVLVALLIVPAAVGGEHEVGWLPPPEKPTMQTVRVYIPVEVGGITELRNWLDEFHGEPNHEIIANGFEMKDMAPVGNNFMISVGPRGTWAYIVVTHSPEGGEYTIVHYGDGFESAPWPSTGA